MGAFRVRMRQCRGEPCRTRCGTAAVIVQVAAAGPKRALRLVHEDMLMSPPVRGIASCIGDFWVSARVAHFSGRRPGHRGRPGGRAARCRRPAGRPPSPRLHRVAAGQLGGQLGEQRSRRWLIRARRSGTRQRVAATSRRGRDGELLPATRIRWLWRHGDVRGHRRGWRRPGWRWPRTRCRRRARGRPRCKPAAGPWPQPLEPRRPWSWFKQDIVVHPAITQAAGAGRTGGDGGGGLLGASAVDQL